MTVSSCVVEVRAFSIFCTLVLKADRVWLTQNNCDTEHNTEGDRFCYQTSPKATESTGAQLPLCQLPPRAKTLLTSKPDSALHALD